MRKQWKSLLTCLIALALILPAGCAKQETPGTTGAPGTQAETQPAPSETKAALPETTAAPETAPETTAPPETETLPETPDAYDELHPMEHMGQVPDELAAAVQKNAFHSASAFGDRLLILDDLLTYDQETRTVGRQVRMMDLFGNDLAVCPVSSHDAYHIRMFTATDDGGFLFVLGFEDYSIDVEKGIWASSDGFASRVIKCEADGSVRFDTPLDGIEGYALLQCIELNGKYYLFGSHETPETKTVGVGSPTEVYAVVLDQDGHPLKSKSIAGSDYDYLSMAKLTDGQFVLFISSQSDDGDFEGSNSKGYAVNWIFTLDEELEIVEKSINTERDLPYSDVELGVNDGSPVFRSEVLGDGFDAGEPTAVIDYGAWYLIVSEHNCGEYENKPSWVSATWYLTETVYSGYDKSGTLLFRTSADSSPDYDAMAEAFNSIKPW